MKSAERSAANVSKEDIPECQLQVVRCKRYCEAIAVLDQKNNTCQLVRNRQSYCSVVAMCY